MKSKCDLLRSSELDRSFKEYKVIRKEQIAIQADHELLKKKHTTLQADHLAVKKEFEHVASQVESKQGKHI